MGEFEASDERQWEAALMRRLVAREPAALTELVQQYAALVFATAFKVLKHYEDSEDVTSEVLATIWRKADSYHPGKGSLVTWICTTTRNRAIDRVRSVQRRGDLYERYEARLEIEKPRHSSTGHAVIYRQETQRMLQSAVVSLSPEQREVIELAYFEGLTQKQIADRIDSPLGTVKARIRRGVEQLRLSLRSRLEGEGPHLLQSASE